MPYPVSVQLYTVRELTRTPTDFRRVVGELAAMGYAAVETGGTGDMKLTEFKRFLDGLGLRCSSMWAQPSESNLPLLIEQAQVLGFTHYVGCWGPEQVKSPEETKKTAAAFNRMAELLEPHGLQMLYHNHAWEFGVFDDQYAFDLLFASAPRLRCQIDTYWASNFGQVDVPRLVRKYAARTPILHIKDGPLVRDQPNTAVGEGKLDNIACINAADPSVLKWLVVELDRCAEGEDMLQICRRSLEHLRKSGLGIGRN